MLKRHLRAAVDGLKSHLDLRHLFRSPRGLPPLEHDALVGLPGDHAADLERPLDDPPLGTGLEANSQPVESRLELPDENVEHRRGPKVHVDADAHCVTSFFHTTSE